MKENLDKNPAELEDFAEETPIVSRPKNKRKGPKILITLILIVVLVVVVLLFISKFTNWDVLGINKINETAITAKASQWQAVFLTNGQVYFGKLKGVHADYPELEDVYYLQVQEIPIQPAEPALEESGVQPAQETQQQLILVKFGTELHKPMDKMYINKDHILMYENLAEDSGVVSAIESYKESLIQ